MTNLEIVTNLFQNLEKFEQSVFLTKFNNSDSLNVTKITKDGYKIEINIDKAFDKSPKIDTNCEMMCINFFESINIDEVINTKNDLELIEFLSLYHTNTITYSQMYAKDLKFNLQNFN